SGIVGATTDSRAPVDSARRPSAATAAFPMRGGGAAGRVVVMGGRPSVPSGGSVVVGRWGTWDVRLRGAVGGAWSGGCGLARPGPDRARTRPGEPEVRLRPAPQHPARGQG